jgi:hypothetical protein
MAKSYVSWCVHILDWGPDKGLPALVRSTSRCIEGYLFSTEKLAETCKCDEFEGFQYQRVLILNWNLVKC